MKLYLTINQKLVDSIDVDPLLREDKTYLEQMKQMLLQRYDELHRLTTSVIEFYLDPLHFDRLPF